MKKTQLIFFTDEDGKEYSFTVDKSVKLLRGHRYRLYFKQSSAKDTPSFPPDTCEFLGYEELLPKDQ